MSEPQLVIRRHQSIISATINRPKFRNALNEPIVIGLSQFLDQLENDPSLSAAILSGAGNGFCSGMDLNDYLSNGALSSFVELTRRATKKPVIAAIEGYAMGGGLELALMCDIVIASESAKFAVPEVKVGLIAGAGGAALLPRRIGYSAAAEMLMTGDPKSAEEMHRLGFVNHVVANGMAFEKASTIADKISRNSGLAVRSSKMIALNAVSSNDENLREIAAHAWNTVDASPDSTEGPKAFLEKRSPLWTT
jgi:enoyl-CoA hydratase/carnithine racemase